MRIARAVSSFSLLLAAVLCLATDYPRLASDLKAARTLSDKAHVLKAAHIQPNADPALAEAAANAADSGDEKQFVQIQKMVERRAALGKDDSVLRNAARQAAAIKSSRMYVDPGVKEESNWLSGATDRLARLFERQGQTPQISGARTDLGGLGQVLLVLAWVLLGGLILLFAYFVVGKINFSRRLKRKASALLDDDEPERTLDEWLAMADRLFAEGKHREAVRCLYLACLLRFDEHGVARFVRGQTNWEHLRRIETSPKLPDGLDFVAPTKQFDTIWYGMKTRGEEDVQQFRDWYQGLTRRLAEAPR